MPKEAIKSILLSDSPLVVRERQIVSLIRSGGTTNFKQGSVYAAVVVMRRLGNTT